MEVWQQKHQVFFTDEKELADLYLKSQQKYNRFTASLPARHGWTKNISKFYFSKPRRMAEHRGKLVRAELRSNLALLESPPCLADYSPSQWATFHSLPLHTATAARILHTRCMERSEDKNYLGRGFITN